MYSSWTNTKKLCGVTAMRIRYLWLSNVIMFHSLQQVFFNRMDAFRIMAANFPYNCAIIPYTLRYEYKRNHNTSMEITNRVWSVIFQTLLTANNSPMMMLAHMSPTKYLFVQW